MVPQPNATHTVISAFQDCLAQKKKKNGRRQVSLLAFPNQIRILRKVVVVISLISIETIPTIHRKDFVEWSTVHAQWRPAQPAAAINVVSSLVYKCSELA